MIPSKWESKDQNGISPDLVIVNINLSEFVNRVQKNEKHDIHTGSPARKKDCSMELFLSK